ncbi:MAG: DMT family transporter [Planctomycetia bacterium]|nr:DMT family transporter [Planctomycetia bacterium]
MSNSERNRNEPETAVEIEAAAHARHTRDVLLGTILALVSAVLYTVTNMCLKAASESNLDPYWIACLKAVPTLVLAGVIVGWDRTRGRPMALSAKSWFWLTLTGLLAHIGGNVAFQWGLGIVGLAAAVPLTFSMILVGGALLGRFWLGEGITPRSVVAIATLCVSIVLLGMHAEAARARQPDETVAYTPFWVGVAIGVVCFSGIAYAVLGVAIRRMVTGGAASAPVLLVISIAGVTSLGWFSVARLGIDGILATSSHDFQVMLWAGIFNAVAFFLLTKAFHLIPVAYVNVVNASQTALAALAGVFYFHEPSTSALIAGVGLMVAGLFMMDRPRRR